MVYLEKELFNPIFDFLTDKKEYFKLFDVIANNKKDFTSNHGAVQYKTEDWLKAELAILLTKKGMVVGTEVNRIDLCAYQKGHPEEKIFIEMKVYVNSGRNPKSKSIMEYDINTTKDLKNIENLSKNNKIGLALILLPKDTKHDKKVGYSEYFCNSIKKDFSEITEVYSRFIIYNKGTKEGFWVTWWSFNCEPTKYQELSKYYNNLN